MSRALGGNSDGSCLKMSNGIDLIFFLTETGFYVFRNDLQISYQIVQVNKRAIK